MKNITQVLKPNLVIFNLNASSKDEVLTEMAQKLSQEGIVANEMSFIETLKEREAISTTGVGDGIAIPMVEVLSYLNPLLSLDVVILELILPLWMENQRICSL